MALRAVHEDRHREKDGAERELAAGEDRPRRDAELMFATLAFEDWTRTKSVNGEATAARATRLAARSVPTDLLEGFGGFLVAHARDLRQTERPGLRAEEEVLRHNRANILR